MKKNRLETFSDGVLAIIITIMVLELKVPEGYEFKNLAILAPKFLSYVLSFIYLAIYWNNHHHLMHTVNKLTSGILWANMNLLFWLSLIPFTTAWVGENITHCDPMSLYGFILLMAAVSYWLLSNRIIDSEGNKSLLLKAIGKDFKGKISIVIYAIGILSLQFVSWIAPILYILVAILWIIPDRRIKNNLT
ncbi:DUF1211 domain-containing protein [Flavobacterium jejuense]|uniref:DUF1211 domain-containing protein n=1 Tax=Flavobacterium jejuense TaxID=1544455 RepID=A0ABX0IN94_9FLAO|nr:TMEM175 family protein [Flavobacterium jejuense]NHN24259.1 DUF1211 domain-containing protein [Flavobacterium jejuense]